MPNKSSKGDTPKKAKPISLSPLNPKEVLAALLRTPPPNDDPQPKEPPPKDSSPQ